MRVLQIVMLAIGASMLTSQMGCSVMSRFREPANPAPVIYDAVPTKEQLIANLNAQSQRVKQLKTEIRVSIPGMPVIKGTLAVERPKRLRLKAGLMGISEMGVDVGSNDQEFWVWTKASLPGESPSLVYANHRQFEESSVSHSIPLRPSWLIDALGFAEFDPNDRHEGPFLGPNGRLKINTYQQTANGQIVRVTVINPKHGWIEQQAIYDARNQLIAYVDSLEHRYYPDVETSLPQQIKINLKQPGGADMSLVVDAQPYTINAIYGDPEKLWAMPNPKDVRKIDLTQVSNDLSPTQNRGVGIEPSVSSFRYPSRNGQLAR